MSGVEEGGVEYIEAGFEDPRTLPLAEPLPPILGGLELPGLSFLEPEATTPTDCSEPCLLGNEPPEVSYKGRE